MLPAEPLAGPAWPRHATDAEPIARPRRPSGRLILTLILLGALAWSARAVDWTDPLIHADGLSAARRIGAAALRPNLSPPLLRIAAGAAWQSLAYATAGVSLALALSVPLAVVASGVLTRDPRLGALFGVPCRAVLAVLRSIHELVWAWLFVAAIGLSPLAAVFALALPYAGILGRIFADRLNDVPAAPLAALRAAGAREWQVLVIGRLPAALPGFVSYALYRYECGIRSASIMSFVGLGGLGFQIQISLDDLRFREVWTFVYALVAMVVLVDLWSGALRRRLDR